jgi:hypothetical protein
MAYTNKKGIVTINDGIKVVKREIRRMLKHTMVTLVGPAGTGKTVLAEEIFNDPGSNYDELIILRVQGLSSEDFRVPIVNTITYTRNGEVTEEKEIEFAQVGVFKKIKDNPTKRYLVFLDEVNRASTDLLPLFFGLFEKKFLDGIKRENVDIISAINDGDAYATNIDFSDPALRRRAIFIGLEPQKEDFLSFIKRRKYHNTVVELGELLQFSVILDYDTFKEYEQTTNFGSWHLFNERLKDIELEEGRSLNYEDIQEDISIFGSYYFSDKTKQAIVDKLIFLAATNLVDIQKEIIDKGGLQGKKLKDRNGNLLDITNREREMLIKTMLYIKSQFPTNLNYFEKNIINIIQTFKIEKTLFISLITEVEGIITAEFGADSAEKFFAGIFRGIMAEANKGTPEGALAKEILAELTEAYTIFRKF